MTGTILTDEQRIAWLRLIRSDNIGPATFRDLLNHFGSAAAAIEGVPALAERGGRRVRICPADDAERELEAATRLGARLVGLGEPSYPPWLRAVDSAPPLLLLRGADDCLLRPTVAIVGSRNASIAGRKFAMQISARLGEVGLTIASGLARGIDAAAHEAALPTGTVAVFAGGLDCPYPPDNIELAERILRRDGAHLSEMPMGHVPRGKDFPRRNRIISGLSLAVVVVEAAVRSGSLITARRAADQGRLVFAVPGSPLDPRAGGTNLLIREGAAIVTAIDDIVSEVSPMLSGRPPLSQTAGEPDREDRLATDATDPERASIVEAMGRTPVDLDEIIRFTGLTAPVVRLVLLELELAGRLEHHNGGRVSLVG
jgi:DNA processing protein